MFRVAKVTVCKTDGEIPRRFESYYGHKKYKIIFELFKFSTIL